MDYELVMLILVFIEGLVVLKGLMELSNQIEEGLAELDQTLAEAIMKVVDGVGSIEQINPIQAALAQVLTNSVVGNQPASVIEISKGADGQFLKKE